MASITVTYSFSNSTTADATQVNQNFTDIINGTSDGTKDFSINALTCAGNVNINGNTTIGNASSDTITVTASLASSIPIGTTNTYDIGSSTLGLRALYFGANSQTVNIKGSGSMSATWTMTLPISAGTVNYLLETDGNGVTSWTKRPSSIDDIRNISLSTSVSASALTITLKGADGSDLSSTNYGLVVFRNATITTGTPTEVKITSNLTITVSSGSTLGHSSGNAHNIFIYLINNAGTAELAVSQILFHENQVVTTTAEGGAGAADSNIVMYSTSARTGVAFRAIGLAVSTQATAGTWSTAISALYLGNYGSLVKNNDISFVGNGASSAAIGSNTDIKYASVVDPINSYASADGSWTAPETRKYKVTVALRMTGSPSAGQYIDAIINVDGANVREFLKYVENASAAGFSAISSWQGSVAAGTKIKFIGDTNITSPALTTGSTHTYMEIMAIP